MPGTAYPADNPGSTYAVQFTATQGRTSLAAAMGGATAARPLGGLSGVRPGTPSNIATATSTTWTVTPFGGYIDLATSATNGGYFFSFQANQTGTVTAAVASARVDLLYTQSNDVNTSDGSAMAPQTLIGYQAGVGGAGVPVLSAARAFVIAQINVPASGGGSPTVTWVAPYCVAAGGILPVPTTVYPASPYVGQYVDDAVLGLRRYNGTGWGNPASNVVAPSAFSGTGVVQNANGSLTLTSCTTLDLVFVTSAYDNYNIQADLMGPSSGTAAIQTAQFLTALGSPDTAALYYRSGYYSDGTTVTPLSGTTTATSADIGNTYTSTAGRMNTTVDLYNLGKAEPSRLISTVLTTGLEMHRVGSLNNSNSHVGVRFTFALAVSGVLRISGKVAN